MAVFITGVGGISTADATALPDDVINGKVFYNAEGRQIGTGESGIVTDDATALPDDVATGKIFYNADGRQVGTGEVINKILLPQNFEKHQGSDYVFSGCSYETVTGYTFSLADADTGTFPKDYYVKLSGIRNIIGIEIDGHYSSCPSISGYTAYSVNNSETNYIRRLWFYHYGEDVYLTCENKFPSTYKNRQIIIYYTNKQ